MCRLVSVTKDSLKRIIIRSGLRNHRVGMPSLHDILDAETDTIKASAITGDENITIDDDFTAIVDTVTVAVTVTEQDTN